jgi:hypothetical protein
MTFVFFTQNELYNNNKNRSSILNNRKKMMNEQDQRQLDPYIKPYPINTASSGASEEEFPQHAQPPPPLMMTEQEDVNQDEEEDQMDLDDSIDVKVIPAISMAHGIITSFAIVM